MEMCTSVRWEETDGPIFFYTPVTAPRETINITTDSRTSPYRFLNGTLNAALIDTYDLLDDLGSVPIVDPEENTMAPTRRELNLVELTNAQLPG